MRVPCEPHLVLCGWVDFGSPPLVESEFLAAVASSFVGPGQDNWSLVDSVIGTPPVWHVFGPVRLGFQLV